MSALMGGGALRAADYPLKKVLLDAEMVRERLARIVGDDDLRRYIL